MVLDSQTINGDACILHTPCTDGWEAIHYSAIGRDDVID